jgi:A/G-specific adenine glycosylase
MNSAAVLRWGVPRLRDLPWRRTRDPWAILVSEVMLQQTHVRRVIPKYDEFLEVFPDAAACAAAPLGDVLRVWQGLGYPRRARNLHACAQRVVELGEFPSTLDELLALPGVGKYTARALLAFAFESEARVYARVEGRRLTSNEAQRLADEALPCGEAWAWNQCLMELGATLCRPTSPRCDECPLHASCAWHRDGGHDPAIGSAGVSRWQAPYAGSDREARGALLRAAASGPITDPSAVALRSPDRALALVLALEREGLLARTAVGWVLP